MYHVVRDPNGSVISLHREPVAGSESLPSNHPEVLAFLGQEDSRSFAEMDANLVRVLEDLIDALLKRNILRITDLPVEAQAKLFERKHFRENMQGNALKLFGDHGHSLGEDTAAGAPTDFGHSGLIPPDWTLPDTPPR
jgi:hypothetical protein